MLKHILVPLDGSDLAEAALKSAKLLLAPRGKLTLVTAIEIPDNWDFGLYPPTIYEESKNISSQVVAQAKDYLERLAAHLQVEGYDVSVHTQFGDAAVVILEVATERKVDMIAMSTHGRSGLSRWLFGSVTGKVLSAAPCPVLVLPNKRTEPVQRAVSPLTAVKN